MILLFPMRIQGKVELSRRLVIFPDIFFNIL